jgi:IS5 family transposase
VLFSLLAMISANGSPDALDKVRLALEASSAGWFNLVKWAGYAVALGCAMEAPETFIILRRWWFLKFRDIDHEETNEDRKSWHTPLATVGLIVIVIGIVLETFGESKVSDVDALLRTHESEKLSAAEQQSASATRDAGTARNSAITAAAASSDAKTSSSNAAAAAVKAISASGDAITTAAEARKEADSYARDIAAAKQEAANAVSHLAEAEKKLAESTEREAAAEARLAAIKTPRSLINAKELIAALKPLEGTEYTLNVFQDDESIQFTKSVDEVLREAGWVRRQKGTYRLGVPSFNIFKDDTPNHDESVPVCVETGIQIHVRSTKSLQVLLAMSATDLPINVRNAATLRGALQGSIAPTEEHNVGERVILDEANPGEGPMVICVGKKP